MRPDATGIQQTHWKKSIRYSSRYCSVVGFAPPLRHCGLAARHRRSPPTRSIPRAGDIARRALPRPPRNASRWTLASLRRVPEPRRLAQRHPTSEPPRASRRPLLTCLKRERGGGERERRCNVKRLRQVGKKGGKKKKGKRKK
jgi:hypothetical protein